MSRTVHIRVEGETREISLDDMNLTENSSTDDVRQAVATYLDKPVSFLSAFQVERTSGGWTIRPNAVFGIV